MSATSSVHYFSTNYAEARQRFARACSEAGANVSTFPVPAQPPGGAGTDVVVLGDPKATRAVLVVSGTHGPEGLPGSACQLALLDDIAASGIPVGLAVVLVHAINAWGVATGMRCTEEGVDLNRNFVRHSVDGPPLHERNPGYTAVHVHLQRLANQLSTGHFLERAPALLTDACGPQAINCLFQGQYRTPDGVGFGGLAPTTARDRLERILLETLVGATDVALVDIHTGLGPYAEGSRLCLAPFDSDEAARVRQFYGSRVVFMNAPESRMPYDVFGDTASGVRYALPAARVTGLTIEFGTYDVERLVRCVLSEYLLRHRAASIRADERRAMHDANLAFFNPDDAVWRHRVIEQSRELVREALDGLTKG